MHIFAQVIHTVVVLHVSVFPEARFSRTWVGSPYSLGFWILERIVLHRDFLDCKIAFKLGLRGCVLLGSHLRSSIPSTVNILQDYSLFHSLCHHRKSEWHQHRLQKARCRHFRQQPRHSYHHKCHQSWHKRQSQELLIPHYVGMDSNPSFIVKSKSITCTPVRTCITIHIKCRCGSKPGKYW